MPWPVHPNGLLGAQGDNDGYRVERSLRFNSADSATLTRTFVGAGTSKTTSTISFWVKRSKLTTTQAFYQCNSTNYNIFYFNASDVVAFSFRNGGEYYSNQVFRDTSSWYHILINYDSTNATQADRFRFYINGVRGTFLTSPAFALAYEFEGDLGVAGGKIIGNFYAGGYLADFYLAEYHFVDGQALPASSFTETDAVTGRLKAKAYSGTYGNHGFYLKFADNSGATATTLGKDSSGNGNNWTPNNFSVTAGTGNDSLVDSPTNYGTDTGVGGEVRGNCATLTPLINQGSGGYTLSDGNLRIAAGTTTNGASSISTIGVTSGKWYAEFTYISATAPGATTGDVGIVANPSDYNFNNGNLTIGAYSRGYSYALSSNSPYKFNNGSLASYGASWSVNDVLGVALDLDAGTLTFYKNGTSQGVAFTSLPSGYSWFLGCGGSSFVFYANFGQRPFAYTAPTGFKALCTTNLPTPTIKKPSSYFDALAYTGTGASNSISSLGFSPDLVWIKNRGGATSHAIYDTTRGTQSQLSSDTTGDQVTSSSGLIAFGSNGFTISTSTLVNTTGTQYVAWAWDQSTQDGFTISTYIGSGANRTIDHTLGVAPKMVIVKARTTAGADQGWPVWHTSIANTTYLQLNSTAATAAGADYWNSTSPTSSVFSVGTNVAVNANADTYIAYLFAEVDGFSKFGTYTGNGAADGPFVYCGFRPRYILIKLSGSAGGSWIIHDTSRNDANMSAKRLLANTSDIEGSDNGIDILSNGFKMRSADGSTNTSGVSHIFAAFAESPFKYARAR